MVAMPSIRLVVLSCLFRLFMATDVQHHHHASSGISIAYAQRLSIPPGWSFSTDLSFPSSASFLNSYTGIAPFSLFVPIVRSSEFDAGAKGFSFGFLSLFDTPSAEPSRISLSVCLGLRDASGAAPFLVPIWTLNIAGSLKQEGKEGLVELKVREGGLFSLLDGDKREVWNISVGELGILEMQSNGNFMILAGENRTVWQSFDNPSDSLLPGQKLTVGMEVTSRNGMYKMMMQEGALGLYKESDDYSPLLYWAFFANEALDEYFGDGVGIYSLDAAAPVNLTAFITAPNCNGGAALDRSQAYFLTRNNSFFLQDACSNNSSAIYNSSIDFYRLDDDGMPRDYGLRQLPDSTYSLGSIASSYRPCMTPNVCGSYGICSVSNDFGNALEHQCRCPSETDSRNLTGAFRLIDISNPSQGCERNVALDCGELALQSLEEVDNVAFSSMLPLFELTWRENTMPLEACKAKCSSNCSCSGVFYHRKSSFCLPFGDHTGLSNVSFISISSEEHIAFVKLQRARKSGNKLLPVIVSIAILIPISVFLVALAVYWKRYTLDPDLRKAEEELLGVLPSRPIRFSYEELRRYTADFSKRLGSGGFGSVYEGALPDGRRVAVKKLELLSHGQKEFLAEIATIGSITHMNIVALYGFCLEKQYRLLVYEYLENGSLDRWIFCKEEQDSHMLSWEARFNVALGTARGLAYLHEECPNPILHFDVKPQNILLDENLNAKLADFGLSKLVAREQSSINTQVRGTPGYIAPEWALHSIVSKKCDVYSFGMVLLELISGRKNAEIELMGSEEYYFPKWAITKTKKGEFADLLDKRLRKSISIDEKGIMEEVEAMICVALLCIHEEPEMRPSMTVVCGMLDGSVALPHNILTPSMTQTLPFRITMSGSIEMDSQSSSKICLLRKSGKENL
ncbi:hypothetical protein KP509_13G088200 [Ceratopteris richardii]|uniref:Receptor-like serine/threonine-protein kinase n=1 Tax=Ceratopteris richardii TaxID=49495 RepID=A0A8T2THR5_CERRI|nr:hypothetical protein KP509_13G088200 [Ceratopteris richardii]